MVRIVSSELAHFVGRGLPEEARFTLLLRIIKQGRLLPKEFQEKWAGLPAWDGGTEVFGITEVRSVDFTKTFSSNEKYLSGIVCFCDIPEDALERHLFHYGRFGVSFPRPFLVNQGAAPVFYIPRDSQILTNRDYSKPDPRRGWRSRQEVFDAWEGAYADEHRGRHGQPTPPPPSPFAAFVEKHFFSFVKFFDSSLPEDHKENYYMEREWRVIGLVSFLPRDLAKVYVPLAFEDRAREALPGVKITGLG